MMRELGQMISPLTVVDHFAGLLDGFVLDQTDAAVQEAVGMPCLVTDTLMVDLESKRRLAEETLAFAASMRDARTVRRA